MYNSESVCIMMSMYNFTYGVKVAPNAGHTSHRLPASSATQDLPICIWFFEVENNHLDEWLFFFLIPSFYLSLFPTFSISTLIQVLVFLFHIFFFGLFCFVYCVSFLAAFFLMIIYFRYSLTSDIDVGYPPFLYLIQTDVAGAEYWSTQHKTCIIRPAYFLKWEH